MPTWATPAHRGAQRGRRSLRRVGDELHHARMTAGLSSRRVAELAGISHMQVIRIERGIAPHVDIGVLARLAAVLGHELTVRIYPSGPPVRDKAHVDLLQRFAARLGPTIAWRTEVPIPIQGDPRSADGVTSTAEFDAVVEAETRLHDVQATERRLRAKQRDLGTTRAILLVADTRHNRSVIAAVPDQERQFPVSTRACLASLGNGRDPGADCLVIL